MLIGTEQIALDAGAYVGLAVSSHSEFRVTEAVFEHAATIVLR